MYFLLSVWTERRNKKEPLTPRHLSGQTGEAVINNDLFFSDRFELEKLETYNSMNWS